MEGVSGRLLLEELLDERDEVLKASTLELVPVVALEEDEPNIDRDKLKVPSR
jgi:hypothetical protein